MHTFKSLRKTPILFGIKCLLVVLFCLLFSYFFKNDVSSYTRVMLDELYAEDDIDVLFVGASHTYRSFDTSLIEKTTGLNCFNAGSSSQQLQGSYYLIKEANEHSGIKRVLLDITYSMQHLEKPGVTQTYILTDYMRKGSNKNSYLWSSFGVDGYINDILPILHGVSFSPRNVYEHINHQYLNDSYDYLTFENEEYRGQGFVYNHEVYQGDSYEIEMSIDATQPLSDFSMKYLADIIEYCKANNIELILCEPPMPDGLLSREPNFQSYVERIRTVADENELKYWEFNLAEPELLKLDATCFCDNNHLNGYGAEVFSKAVASLLLSDDKANCFFTTYSEKCEKNPDGTYVE